MNQLLTTMAIPVTNIIVNVFFTMLRYNPLIWTASHRVVRMFWHMVSTEFTPDDVRKLLLFWTGSSVASFQYSNVEPEERVMLLCSYKVYEVIFMFSR